MFANVDDDGMPICGVSANNVRRVNKCSNGVACSSPATVLRGCMEPADEIRGSKGPAMLMPDLERSFEI